MKLFKIKYIWGRDEIREAYLNLDYIVSAELSNVELPLVPFKPYEDRNVECINLYMIDDSSYKCIKTDELMKELGL